MDRGLQNWSAALGLLALSGIAFSLYAIADATLNSEFKIGFDTVSGVRILTAENFTRQQRLVVVGISSMVDVCWIWAFSQIAFLSRLFSKGEILTLGVIKYLRRFG